MNLECPGCGNHGQDNCTCPKGFLDPPNNYKQLPVKEVIHTTIGLYPNGEFKMNGVKPEDLQGHIEYNKQWRWGRALFVDGICVFKGLGISEEQIKIHEQLFKSDKYKAKQYSNKYQ